MMRTITLHAFQALHLEQLLKFLVEGDRHIALLYCTGAGKTEMALALAALTFCAPSGPSFSHVIYTAPTKETRDGFVAKTYSIDDVLCTSPLVKGPNEDALRLEEYLTLQNPAFTVKVTHNVTSRLRPLLRQKLKDGETHYCLGRLCVIDEAHRTGEGNDIAEFKELWLALDGTVVDLTATPERDDGRVAIPDTIRRVERTLSRQMDDGLAPRELFTDTIRVSGASRTTDDCVAEPLDPEEIERSLLKHLLADNRPKAIVRLKNRGSAQENSAIIQAIALKVRGASFRVFVASDVHSEVGVLQALNDEVFAAVSTKKGKRVTTVSELLEYENNCAYDDSCVDIIIGIQGVLEGFNWKQCSHFYFVGIPTGITSIVQGIGRTTRQRAGQIAGYPLQWADSSRVVLLTAGKPEELSNIAQLQMLRVICYLSTFRNWTLLGALDEFFERYAFNGTPKELVKLRNEIEALDIPLARMVEIRTLIEAAKLRFHGEGGVRVCDQMSYHDVANFSLVYAQYSKKYDITLDEIKRVVIAGNREAKSLIPGEVRERVKRGQPIPEAVKEAIKAIADKFMQKEYVPTASAGDEMVADVLHSFSVTGHRMDEIAAAVQELLEGETVPSPTPTPKKEPGKANTRSVSQAFPYTEE